MPSSDEDLKTRVAEAEPQFSTGIAAVLAPAPAALIKLVPGWWWTSPGQLKRFCPFLSPLLLHLGVPSARHRLRLSNANDLAPHNSLDVSFLSIHMIIWTKQIIFPESVGFLPLGGKRWPL